MDWRLAVFLIEVSLGVALLAWLRVAGRGEHPSVRFLATLVGMGSITALIAGIIELRYSLPIHPGSSSGLIVLNNIVISLIEELAKYFVAVLLILHSRYLHKLSDGIIYLIVIGLGFSLVEDALYLVNPQTIAAYRLLSFYLHSGTSAIIGYNLGRYHFHQIKLPRLILGITGAVLLHFAYNLTTFIPDSPLAFYLTLCINVYISLQIFILFRRAVVEEFLIEHRARPKHRTTLLNV